MLQKVSQPSAGYRLDWSWRRVFEIIYAMRELLSAHQGKTAKLQKAKTTQFLHFCGKDVPNLVLNKKDPLWRICRKVVRLSLSKRTPCHVCCCVTNFNHLCKFVSVSKTSCCRLASSPPLQLILIFFVFWSKVSEASFQWDREATERAMKSREAY